MPEDLTGGFSSQITCTTHHIAVSILKGMAYPTTQPQGSLFFLSGEDPSQKRVGI